MSDIKAFVDRRELAADRAEQIRLGLQSSAVLYAAAIAEEDWRTLSYASEKSWAEAEFSPDRFSTENRKRLVSMYGAWGWSQRQIAAATGASQSTIVNDQASDQNRSDSNIDSNELTDEQQIAQDRRRVAREREAQKAAEREAAREREAAQRELEVQRAAQREAERLAAEAKALEDQRRRDDLAARAARRAAAEREREAAEREASMSRTRKIDAAAVNEIIEQGMSYPEIMERFKVGQAAAQLARREADGVIRGRSEAAETAPSGRPKNWNGKSNDKRQRELRAEREGSAYVDLLDAQYKFAQMCQVLEDIHIQDYGLGDVELWKITAIYEDLISLGEWYTRQLSAVQGYLGKFPARERIAKLRNVTGRTPEETATALRLADRLERSLENDLS